MDRSGRWERLGWTLPWLLFLAFPIADAVTTPRPVVARAIAIGALATFTIAYLTIFARLWAPDCPAPRHELVIVVVLGVGLAVWLGPSWSGLLIYVSAALAGGLPRRWVWPAVLAAAAVCAGVLVAHHLFDALFVLPLICLLTAFALRGTRYLITVNKELLAAREELARSAVAEERLRFARDLHDLLGHSLSLIALKSELAGRLAERDPVRARAEMADVEAAARKALAEVREAVSGYRQVTLSQAVSESRGALSAAGISLHVSGLPHGLGEKLDTVLGWVIREATTNVLRHSGAATVRLSVTGRGDEVTLVMADDGRGSDGRSGAGLAGLRERLEAIGGRLEVRSGSAGGFTLAAVAPLTTAQPIGAS